MSRPQPPYTTAGELFARCEELLQATGTAANRLLHEALQLTCSVGLQGSCHAFGNLAAQVDALCRQHGIGGRDQREIHHMRRDGNSSIAPTPQDIAYDVRALCLLVSAVFHTTVPPTLAHRLPHTPRPSSLAPCSPPPQRLPYIRGIVRAHDNDKVTLAVNPHLEGGTLTIDYRRTPEYIDLSYLADLLCEGMQLNLIDTTWRDGVPVPAMVVVEPDFLIDISALANCFEEYGHHPLAYLLGRLRPRPNNRHTLLGNFAGSALDDIVNNDHATMADTLRSNFREKALEYATCDDLDLQAFKQEAERQATNLHQLMGDLFAGYDRRQALLEPSFVCERLGLQGRVDLMTQDMRLLVEQKAGRNVRIERHQPGRHGAMHIEKHYVQVLLYAAMLRQNFGRRADMRLLYSRYPLPDGLLEVQPLQQLLAEAIKLRNRIVATEYDMARRGPAGTLALLSPETLNTEQADGYFYHTYLRPQLEQAIAPLRGLGPVAHAYVCRMMQFVLTEQLLQKTGGGAQAGNAMADLWNMPLATKREDGNIYTDLAIVDKARSTGMGGYDLITLSVPDQGEGFLPNFRRGDMVYLYAYPPDGEPDARKAILHKGSMASIATDRIVIHLNDGQQNEHSFGAGPYAVEHGGSDIGTTAALGSLYALAAAPADRRALLLGEREPRRDASRRLSRSYNAFYDEVLLRARQSQDYFLLVGPPGTGKTSMALRYLVQEELADGPQAALLLMAYTNRAVDEICGMLCDAGIDFIRLGGEFSCDERYREHLLSAVVADRPRLSDLRQRIDAAQVFVGTTSTLASRPFILSRKHFSLVVVDEASQILEPHIVGLLAQTGRFVLIGDYKQLPAVVQQSPEQSAVDSPLLQAIGIDNCRHSLFERLMRWERRQGRTQFVGILNHQGRMHPDVAAWPNRMFYQEERLLPVPCPHQTEDRLPYAGQPLDEADRVLMRQRMVFIPSRPCRQPEVSDKVNGDEARIVARLLVRLHRYWGEAFDARRTVGVIVPYRNQIAMIRRELALTGIEALAHVSIDTVERYQGSQRDVIVYSFTVQTPSQLDFLTSNSFEENGRTIDRKLNVAMTRARRQMILTGNERILRRNPLFAQLIDDVPHLARV